MMTPVDASNRIMALLQSDSLKMGMILHTLIVMQPQGYLLLPKAVAMYDELNAITEAKAAMSKADQDAEMVKEARLIFGDEAADQLKAKLAAE